MISTPPPTSYIVLQAESKSEALRLLDLLSYEIKMSHVGRTIQKTVPKELTKHIYIVHDDILGGNENGKT